MRWTGILLGLCLILHAGCGAARRPAQAGPSPDTLRIGISRLALDLIGLPYLYGGEDITGFDCSGFVHYVFSAFGCSVPRTARKQAAAGRRIQIARARPGDVVVFKLKGGWHSGVVVGRGVFVHAPQSGASIRRETLNGFWLRHLKAVVDVLGKGS